MLKIWPTQWGSWSDQKKIRYVAYQTSRSVSSAWTHLWFFHCSSLSLSKSFLKTAGDLSWPEVTLGDEDGSLAAIIQFRVSNLPVTRCLIVFRMVFVQKRRLSIFSNWLLMERLQNGPDLGSPISKFRDKHFIDTVTDINRWKLSGAAAFEISAKNLRSVQTPP